MGLYSLSDLEYMFWAAIRNGSVGTIGAKGDAGGITLGTALLTSDLNTVVTSGVYRQDNSLNATLARNYPKDSIGGVLVIYERVAPGASASVFQIYYPAVNSVVGTPVTYIRYSTTNNTVWTPWRTFNSTRVDQTAGRAIYQWDDLNAREQLVYGDTGQRDITALKDVNVSTGTAWIRRNGQLVTLNIHAFQLTAGGTGTIFTGTIPTGFTPANLSRTPLITASTFEARLVEVAGSNVTLYNPTNTAAYSGSITYVTNDAWPTVLPGSAVGTIPNL